MVDTSTEQPEDAPIAKNAREPLSVATTSLRKAAVTPLTSPLYGGMSAAETTAQGLRSLAAMHRRLHEDASYALNSWTGFVYRRVNDNIDLAERLVACRSPADVYGANLDYVRKAADEYLAHIERTVMQARGVTTTMFSSMASASSPDQRNGGSIRPGFEPNALASRSRDGHPE